MTATNPAKRLFEAAKKGDIGGIREALAGGAHPDDVKPGAVTPLMIAADKERLSAVQYLLDAGANPNIATRMGLTALHKAIKRGCVEIAKLLLERGADPNTEDCYRRTPLADCFNMPGPDATMFIRLFAERGALERGKSSAASALKYAVIGQDPDLAQFLLERGASPDEPIHPSSPRKALEAIQEHAVKYPWLACDLDKVAEIERLFAEWDAQQRAKS
jgi:hypothetical protein